MADLPRVFTIPASAPFLPTLIAALQGGKLIEGFPAREDPLALNRLTLYLPTRRACRLLRDQFLEITGARAAILPRIVAIGDVDEDEIVFAEAASEAALSLPETIDSLERRLLLVRLIRQWMNSPEVHREGEAPLVANNPGSALALADALARLLDDMTTRQVPWEELYGLVPGDLDEYWELTRRFLRIVGQHWPALLNERNAIEPAARRDALLAAEAKRLAALGAPVVAAGSTGSMPATAALLETIARLPQGAVVLPGLDTELDDAAWQLIAGSKDEHGRITAMPAIGHPQFAMESLLKRIGIARDEVRQLGSPASHGRERIVSEAMRPAATTEHWCSLAEAAAASKNDAALEQIAVVEAATPEEEALAIAIALREAIETGNKTAALVTPDRALARRVRAALERWDVAVDDSGGDSLPDTSAGRFARLAAEAAYGLAPVTLLALLKHPLFRLGAAAGSHAGAISALEIAVLRGARPKPGTSGLAHALRGCRDELAKLRRREASAIHPSEARARLNEDELARAEALVARLAAALAPLENAGSGSHPLAEFAQNHSEVIERLSVDETGGPVAFAGVDGKALRLAFEEIARTPEAAQLDIAAEDYTQLFQGIIGDRVVRRAGQPGVRVRIYGLLEARMQHVDRVVLGSLVEGVWPPETRSDPWLSRPMRQQLGLDLPERRISLSAHDFAQLLGNPEVILAYPAKLAGNPSVPSRFLQRLAAVAGEERWAAARKRGERYISFARMIDQTKIERRPRPQPKPPREARPLQLSVTAIETWLRDPYSIYARYILDLRPLDPVDLAPGAADRGNLIHEAIGTFTKQYAGALPPDPAAALIDIGQASFARLADYPEAQAFWWPRFRRIARWFAAWEDERRPEIGGLCAEVGGRIGIPLGERVFTLTARADRIERRRDGRYAILDYKTGRIPTEKQVRVGFSPQLTLEAAILRKGGFAGIEAGVSVAELVYVALKGGEPAGQTKIIDFKESDANTQADIALDKLKQVATKFESEEQPYLPLAQPMWAGRYGVYDHLARVKEWSIGAEPEGDA